MRVDRDVARRSAGPCVAALAAAALALAGAGCGSSSSGGTTANPAGVVPASAPIYVGAIVRPSGSLQSDASTAANKLTGRKSPYAGLLKLLQSPGSPTLDYQHDVAPWLGPNAGIFFTALGSSSSLEGLLSQALAGGTGASGAWPFSTGPSASAQGAIVLDTSDLDKAKSFVSAAATHAGAHPASYRGVSYQSSSDGSAFAIVDKLVVLGSDSAVRAVIDTSQGGPALEHDSSYSNLMSVAPAGALAHVYGNPRALVGSEVASRPSGLPALLRALGGGNPLDVSLVPSADSIALDADVALGAPGSGATGSSGGLVGVAAAGGHAFGELPGDSWLAAGLGKIGGAANGHELEQLESVLSLASELGGSAAAEAAASPQVTLSLKGILEGLLAPLRSLAANGPQARRDFLSWMGEAGVFASGTTVLELKGAITIDSTDPSASRAAVGKLAAALRKAGDEASPVTIAGTEAAVEAKVSGLPVTLAIADGRDSNGHSKFVIGLSSTSVQEALSPSSRIAASPTLTATQSALGEGVTPTIAVNMGSLLSLLEGIGLSEDPSVTPFLPYLRNSTTLSGGGKSLGGGIERLRLVLGLQPSGH